MSLRPLIAGQTIRIDNHKSGTGEAFEWKGIHLHKTINDKGGKVVHCRVYLDRDEISCNNGEDVINAMKNEVKNALKNPQKRREFVKDVISELGRFSEAIPAHKRQESLNAGANRIAEHFDLEEGFVIEIDKDANQCLTGHYDEKRRLCYILQNRREETITIGEDRSFVKDKALFQKTKN